MLVRAPIEELHDSQLYRFMAEQDGEYAQRVTTLVRGIAPILATTARYFPYYTRHDAHHGFRVTERIAQALDPECLQSGHEKCLLPSEIFLLIAASYTHDLGMTVFPGEEAQLIADLGLERVANWEISPTLQDHLRRNHSKRGGEYIQANAGALGVPVNLVGALDLMMKSHNFSIAELDRELRDPFAAQERVIDVRQLAVVLCIADALEFSDTRVVDGVLDLVKADDSPVARVSYRENMKHICIGDSVAVDNNGRIVVSGTFSDPDVLSLAHHTFDQMEEWIRGYCDIDRRSSIRRLRVRPKLFSRNLELHGARFERLGIRMSKKSVIDLIASNAIWRSSGGICIRELVQNAVEACRYRAHHSTPAQRFTPHVRVTFDRSANTITVLDNGCGMSESVVLNHFLTVGNSRSREPAYADSNYAPIARFGIGFWSVFTITERAQIETAAFEELRGADGDANKVQGIAFEVALSEMKDYTVFANKDLSCGTRVVLRLKPGVVMDDVFDQTRRDLMCSEVNLTLVLDGDEFPIPREVPNITDENILGARLRLKDDLNVQIYRWRGGSDDTELALGLVYRICDGRATFLRDEHNSLLTVLDGIRSPRTSVCGFQVPVRPKALCFDLLRVGAFLANYQTPRGFEFSIDRRQLLDNPASQRFSEDITNLIHDAYRSFLDETNSQNPRAIFELNQQAAMHGGNVYDVYTGSELAEAHNRYADLLCFRLYEVDPNKSFAAAGIHYVSLSTLMGMRGVVWVLQNSYYHAVPGTAYQQHLDPDNLREFVYEFVKTRLRRAPEGDSMYLVDPNRSASMLFDTDPESTVEFHPFKLGSAIVNVCIQRMNLSRIQLDRARHRVLAEVQGRWSGAIYLRDFDMPNRKPYVFLGRHRVLIQESSPLSAHLHDLKIQGRLVKLAEAIANLKEDEAGFTPEAVAELV